MYSIEQLKGIDAAMVARCSLKHFQPVIDELVATALALAEENSADDRLLADEALTMALNLMRKRDELLVALRRYGTHLPDCAWMRKVEEADQYGELPSECSCELENIKKNGRL